MQTYADYSPTSVDRPGAFLEPDHAAWLVVPVGRNRDSLAMAESNFQAAVDLLGGEGEDVEIHRFGHWAVGWCEVLIVRPDTDAARKAVEIEERLAGYAILDDNDLSAREAEAFDESWKSWGADEFVSSLVKKFGLGDEDADLLEGADKENLREFFQDLNPSGDHTEDGEPVIRRSVDQATLEKVYAFLETLETAPAMTP